MSRQQQQQQQQQQQHQQQHQQQQQQQQQQENDIDILFCPEVRSSSFCGNQRFIENLEKTWLVFSDQIPVWVKIGMLKVLYAAFEIEDIKQSADNRKVRKHRQKLINSSKGKDIQKQDTTDAAPFLWKATLSFLDGSSIL